MKTAKDNFKTFFSKTTTGKRSLGVANIKFKAINHFAFVTAVLWAVLFLFGGQARADVLASWETTGLSNFGPSPFTATTANANLIVGGLTRGSGITTGGSAGAAAWGGVNFAGTDEASAISGNDFATFTITANAGNMVSFTDIPAYNIRRSGTGPTTGIWQYQVGSGSFTDIGSAITWGSNTTGTGNSKPAIDLSGISDLQNVPAGTTVTFRIVNWSGGASGTWYINNISAGADLQVEGTVSPAAPLPPGVSAAAGILSSGFTANWSLSSGATGYRLDVSAASDFSSFVSGYNDLDVANVTSYVVSGLNVGTTYYYRVRAYNGSGTSANSSTITVTTSASGIPAMTVALPGQPSANAGTPDAQTAGTPFAIIVTATTDGTTIDTGYSGTKSIVFSGPTGSPTYPATVNFTSGAGTASITLTKAEAIAITATDGTIMGIASSSLTVNPGAIASYAVTASPSQTVGVAFNITVTAVDIFNNTVTADSSTSVTMSSGSGNMLFDTNPKTLASGVFTVSATDNSIETTTITATDANSKTGTLPNVVVGAAPQYRSKQDGNWNDVNTWEISTDGGASWGTAVTTPTAADSTNTILNTVTISAGVTVDQVIVANGGTLVMGSAFNINDGAGDDIDVQNGGVFVLNIPAVIPAFASGATAKIETGGTLRVNQSGLTAAGTGANSSAFVYGDASVLEFNSSGAFSASGVTFFPNVDANTVPIFRNAKANVTVGGGSPTVVNGIFEVAAGLTVTWNSAGTKTFRNGIRGDGNVVQNTSGQFIINGATAELGGGGTVTLNASGLSIDPASVTTLSSDKTVNTAGGAMTVGGVLDLNGKTLTADMTVASGGTLKGGGTLAGTATVSNGGTVSPGSSIGTMTFNNAPVLSGTSSLEIDRGANPNADEIATGGALTYGGALVVANIGAPLQSGDSFTLFAAGGFSGAFDSVTLPVLSPGLSWDATLLATTGVLTVTGSGDAGNGGNLAIHSLVGGGVQLMLTGTAGASYQLQYSDTLSPANWQNIGDLFEMPVEGVKNIADLSGAAARYYRTVKSLP